MNQELTGDYYFKKTIFGLVLMVEVREKSRTEWSGSGYSTRIKYRKAKESDLKSLRFNKSKNDTN